MPRPRVPHTLVLLFGMSVFAFVLCFILPQGAYERRTVELDHEREVVVPGTFELASRPERPPATLLFTAIPKGFAAAQDIIFFIFIVGGCFAVFRATGAADASIALLLARLGHRPSWLIAGGMAVFAAGSSTIGMAEEYLPFVPLLLALAAGLRLDPLCAVAVLCVGYGVGYGVAAINPFTVLVAQRVAELEPTSGLGYRLALTPVFFAIGLHHVLAYARRVREDPSRSLLPGTARPATPLPERPPGGFSLRHGLAIAAVVATLALLVYGIPEWDWYLLEMGALFLALAVLLAAIGRLHPDRVAREFCAGAAELTTTALLVGFARSIEVILQEGRILDTVVHGISLPLEQLGSYGAAVGMLVVQSALNFAIPSGSGQALVTMPLMTPLADIVEVPRQVAVLAYQFGDGFTNILVPTNAVLIGILTMAGVPFDRWLRFVLPLLAKLWVAAALALVVGVAFGYA